MSSLLTGLVWEIPEDVKMTPQAQVVLLCLTDRADTVTGCCYPGKKDIAKRCRMCVRTVFKYLQELEALGLVTTEVQRRKNNSQTSNLYPVHLRQFAPPPGKPLPRPPGKRLPPQNLS